MNTDVAVVTTTDVATIDQTFKEEVMYTIGKPQEVHANAKEGNFNLYGEELIGETLEIHPIAWRVFDAELFGKPLKKWLEIFYVDEIGALSSVLFHGFSVENFKSFYSRIKYKKASLTQTKIKISWDRRENRINGTKNVYFIAKFHFVELLDKEVVEAIENFTKSTPVYRKDTAKGEIEEHQNYPVHLLEAGAQEEGSVEVIDQETGEVHQKDKIPF